MSRKLIDFLKSLPSNQADVPAPERGATIIAHSLGGLITRHAVNKHPELFGGVVYAGVPTTCVNILGPLRNGDEVLLSSKVLTAQVNFTIRTSFALLPLEGRCFFNPETKEEYPVDFFDPQTWVDYRLSPCVGDVLPSMEAAQLGRIDSMISTVASVMPNISMPGRRPSLSRRNKEKSQVEADGRETSLVSDAGDAAQTVRKKTQDAFTVDNNRDIAPTTNAPPRPEHPNPSSTNPSTVVTLSRSKCIVYLERSAPRDQAVQARIDPRSRTPRQKPLPSSRTHLRQEHANRLRRQSTQQRSDQAHRRLRRPRFRQRRRGRPG